MRVGRYRWLILSLLVFSPACSFNRTAAAAGYISEGNGDFQRGEYRKALALYQKALRKSPQSGEAYYRAGLAELKLQKWGEAAQHLQRATELQPENHDAYIKLANLYLFAYSADQKLRTPLLQALRDLSVKVGQKFPNGYDDFRLRGYVAAFTNDPKSAIENFERAYKLKPYEEELAVPYLHLLFGVGAGKAAETLADDFIVHKPNAPGVYEALLAEYTKQNRLADVERILRLRTQNDPGYPPGHLQLAALYYSQGKQAAMTAALEPLKAKTFPNGSLLLGDFHLFLQQFDAALQSYREGLDRRTEEKKANQKRVVEVLYQQGKYAEARQQAESLVKDYRDDAAVKALRASIWVLTKDSKNLDSAIKDLQSAINALPGDFVLFQVLGRGLEAKGDVQGSATQFEEALKLRPNYLSARIELTKNAIDANRLGAALVMCHEILATAPNSVAFETAGQHPYVDTGFQQLTGVKEDHSADFATLSSKLLKAGVGYEEALNLALKASQQRPDDAEIRDTLGLAYLKKNLPAQALSLFAELTRQHPDTGKYRAHLAYALSQKGESVRAKEECHAALSKNPPAEEVPRLRSLCRT